MTNFTIDAETDRLVRERAERDDCTWAEALRRIVRGAARPFPAGARRANIDAPADKIVEALGLIVGSPAREEWAVYACRRGHEQPHAGRCHECGMSTDLARWETDPDPEKG